MKNASRARLVLIGAALVASTSLRAAEVTYDRLQHPEPQNWLMNHHDYSAQRFSPLDGINKSNIKNLKLKFAVALGGKAARESLEATPLVEDGFMYVTDGWGAVYKIDVRSGTAGHIVWKMDPGQDRLGQEFARPARHRARCRAARAQGFDHHRRFRRRPRLARLDRFARCQDR